MKIKRRRQELHTGIVVAGGGPEHKVTSIGAGVAVALSRAYALALGEHVAVLEYGEEIGRAVRTEGGACWTQ